VPKLHAGISQVQTTELLNRDSCDPCICIEDSEQRQSGEREDLEER